MTINKGRIILKKISALFSLSLIGCFLSGFLGGMFSAENPFWGLWCSLIAFLLGNIHFFLPGKMRKWYVVLSVVLYGLFAYFLFPWQAPLFLVLAALPGVFILILAPLSCSSPVGEEWNMGIWIAGLVGGMVIQILFSHMLPLQTEACVKLNRILTGLYLIFFLAFLFNVNGQSLKAGINFVEKEKSVPPSMIRRNRIAVILIFALSLVIAGWGKIEEGALWLWEKIKEGVFWLLSLLKPLKHYIPEAGSIKTEEETLALGEMTEQSGGMSPWVEKLMICIAFVVFCAGVIFVLFFLFKKAVKIFKKLWKMMKKYTASSGEDYVDETENIFDAEEMKENLKKQWHKKLGSVKKGKIPEWKKLTGREKVRFLYWSFLKNHPGKLQLTAREAIWEDHVMETDVKKSFSCLYEKARYSDHEISGEEADLLKNQLKY